MRRVSVFGATGSVGQSTLELIGREPDRFAVVALTGGRNVMKLASEARRLNAEIAVTAHPDSLESLTDALAGSGIAAAAGAQAIADAACRPVDWAMSAIVGAAGLAPGLRVLEQGATLALANKESLVTAGPLVLATAAAHGATLLPVDSEHSAVFQAMRGEDIASVERVILTASGGPFRDWSRARMAAVTVAQASRHPNWQMGQRITIDSASLFNKAMEVIETHEFFGIPPDRIEVIVHPESLIHALVGHHDGGLIAHVGPPDMRHAIGYALNWPDPPAAAGRAAGPGAHRPVQLRARRRGPVSGPAAGARGDGGAAVWPARRSTPRRRRRWTASSVAGSGSSTWPRWWNALLNGCQPMAVLESPTLPLITSPERIPRRGQSPPG